MLQGCLGTLVGQHEAVEEFRRLAVAKLQSMDSTSLVALIVGDSGTGKTSMGIALSLAISSSTGRSPLRGGDCLVLIDCSKYKEPRDLAHAVQMVEQIEHHVALQMSKCPESVILGE
jgi:ABC-type glutathione transport system ATPase component